MSDGMDVSNGYDSRLIGLREAISEALRRVAAAERRIAALEADAKSTQDRVEALEGQWRIPAPLFKELVSISKRVTDAEFGIAALKAAPANSNETPRGVVYMSRELHDQTVESLQAIYDVTDRAMTLQDISDLHEIATEALERLGVAPE